MRDAAANDDDAAGDSTNEDAEAASRAITDTTRFIEKFIVPVCQPLCVRAGCMFLKQLAIACTALSGPVLPARALRRQREKQRIDSRGCAFVEFSTTTPQTDPAHQATDIIR